MARVAQSSRRILRHSAANDFHPGHPSADALRRVNAPNLVCRRIQTLMTDAELVAGYVAHATTTTRDGTDAEHFEAREELDELISDEPERAWPVICEIVRPIAPADEDILAYVAAGPLEDLLARHPNTFIDRIEELAINDAHFRRAVSGVWGWIRIPSDIRTRLDKLLGDAPRL